MFNNRHTFLTLLCSLLFHDAFSSGMQSACQSGIGHEFIRDRVYGCDGSFHNGKIGLAKLCAQGFELCSSTSQLQSLGFTAETCRSTPRHKFYAAGVSGQDNTNQPNTFNCGVDQSSDLWGCTATLPRTSSCFANEGWAGMNNQIKCGNVLNGVIRAIFNPRNNTCLGWSAETDANEAYSTKSVRADRGGALCCATERPSVSHVTANTAHTTTTTVYIPTWKIDLFWASVVVFWISCGFCCAGMLFTLYAVQFENGGKIPLLEGHLSDAQDITPRDSISSATDPRPYVEEEIVLHSIADLDQNPEDEKCEYDPQHVVTVRPPFQLEEWLGEIDPQMTMYKDVLTESGFDSIGSLKLLMETDAESLQIPREDMQAIMDRVQRLV